MTKEQFINEYYKLARPFVDIFFDEKADFNINIQVKQGKIWLGYKGYYKYSQGLYITIPVTKPESAKFINEAVSGLYGSKAFAVQTVYQGEEKQNLKMINGYFVPDLIANLISKVDKFIKAISTVDLKGLRDAINLNFKDTNFYTNRWTEDKGIEYISEYDKDGKFTNLKENKVRPTKSVKELQDEIIKHFIGLDTIEQDVPFNIGIKCGLTDKEETKLEWKMKEA